MRNKGDIEFIRELKRGDAEAWRCLFVRYYSVYVRFTAKITGDSAAAKDIVQDMFMKLWKNRDRLDENASLESLLYVIARNSSFTWLRDRRPSVPVGASVEDAPVASVEDELLDAERIEQLTEAVCSLPEQRRNVMKLKLGGVTNRKISEELGVSEKTVERHITLAIHDLKNRLKS